MANDNGVGPATASDLIIRNGTIVDGLGGEPFVGDVAIADGVITAVGTVEGSADRELDATGLLVTPGFVDLHTHYDGQAIWSDRMTPSSAHGVTTAVMGNCGVGFAPCRAEDHDVLVDVMAGVEDIPGVVMVDGLPWSWETFPEFLDTLEAGRRDIDVAAYLPHSPLRVYVMGQRGVDRDQATPEDLAMMRKLAAEAISVGALGFASSRLTIHKTESGQPIPSYDAAQAEIEAIARGVDDAGGGLIQFVPDLLAADYEQALQTVFDVAADVGSARHVHAGDRKCRSRTASGRAANGGEGQRQRRRGQRTDVPEAHRPGHRARAVRQPVRDVSELPGTRPSAARRSASPRCANPKCANASWPTSQAVRAIR